MKVESISIQGFKCFSNETKTKIKLDDMTCFIGTNGSGKTAVLEALCRLFGESENLRKVRKSDFYVDVGKNIDDYDTRELTIEARITFPELDSSDCSEESVPLAFNNMIVEKVGEKPFCKILLQAIWEKGNTSEGNLEYNLYWNTSIEDVPEDNDLRRFTQSDKNLIRVYYIPAIRNPENQIKSITGSAIKRLFDAIKWDSDIKESIEQFSNQLITKFQSEDGIKNIQAELQHYWSKYMTGSKYRTINLTPIGNDLSSLLNNVDVYFSPADTKDKESIGHLSDGTKSVFYLTLLNTLFEIESKKQDEVPSFDMSLLNKPALSIFALEEPENHLAPHYLGRILSVFSEINKKGAQTVITSHSPAIVKRLEPENIRYFRQEYYKSIVKEIKLPTKADEAYKYVKEAVKAYPELYFSKLVILGEGDSEELVIPKLAKMSGIDIDTSFASFVPLGGRFVNHFWKLLEDLKIPYITLLDFDKGRKTGGQEKIKYVTNQLVDKQLITETEMETIETMDEHNQIMELEKKNIYFSYPIDLDFLMLTHYFDEYTKSYEADEGPRIPNENDSDWNNKLRHAIAHVLKKDDDEITDLNVENPRVYFWYNYLFLGRGKPVSHLLGMANIEVPCQTAPIVLESFINKLREML